MWLPDSRTGLYELQAQQELAPDHWVYKRINSAHFDLDRWLATYGEYHRRWLEQDDDTIYQWHQPLNQQPIEAAQRFNRESMAAQLYFWLDVDRSLEGMKGFQWRRSPLSGKDCRTWGRLSPP
ncbi:hypothetical protein [Hymenobacter sp. B81]|uniref:hypothetical protein n=1 Tax=Hymenobacter sp. B81 TaxID=3344878 RepID=UPI0037DD459F